LIFTINFPDYFSGSNTAIHYAPAHTYTMTSNSGYSYDFSTRVGTTDSSSGSSKIEI
jgi:hypothetical protein